MTVTKIIRKQTGVTPAVDNIFVLMSNIPYMSASGCDAIDAGILATLMRCLL